MKRKLTRRERWKLARANELVRRLKQFEQHIDSGNVTREGVAITASVVQTRLLIDGMLAKWLA